MTRSVGAYTQNPAKHHKTTDGWELYDLSNDIGQDHNIAVQHPEWVDRLSKAYDQWWKDVRPMMINEPK